MSSVSVEKTLKFGLPQKDGEPVRRVVFSKRPTVADAIRISDSEQGSIEMQLLLMYAGAAITEFGDKKRSPHLVDLLKLKRVDRDIIVDGYMDFIKQSKIGRTSEKLDDDSLLLLVGLEIEGEVYDVVTFCDRVSQMDGYEEQELLRKVRKPNEQQFVLLGQDIARLSQREGELFIEGPLDLDKLKLFDAMDGNAMIEAVDERRLLFRGSGEVVQENSSSRNQPSSV